VNNLIHNMELCDLYRSLRIVRIVKSTIQWAEHVAKMEETRNTYTISFGKPVGKCPLQ